MVDFAAKDLSNNELFECTIAEEAKTHNQFNPKATYKPVPIVVGKKDFFEPIDKAFEQMQVGDEKRLVLQPNEAFGERKSEMITIIPLQDFRKNNMHPIPGLIVEADGKRGKVQSVSGGRVRVDFNHPLAGKTVEYKVIVRKKIENKNEQVNALLEKFFPHVEEKERLVKVENDAVSIELPERLNANKETGLLKEIVQHVLPKQLEWVKKVSFSEKKSEKAEPKAKSESKEAETKSEPRATALPAKEAAPTQRQTAEEQGFIRGKPVPKPEKKKIIEA